MSFKLIDNLISTFSSRMQIDINNIDIINIEIQNSNEFYIILENNCTTYCIKYYKPTPIIHNYKLLNKYECSANIQLEHSIDYYILFENGTFKRVIPSSFVDWFY